MTGDGQITTSKLDLVFPPGSKGVSVRFGCSMAAELAVDLRDGKQMTDVQLDDTSCKVVEVPDGNHMIIVHVTKPAADGTPVSFAWKAST